MNKITKIWIMAFLGAAAGVGVVLLIRKRKIQQPAFLLPQRSHWLLSWQRLLEKQRGTVEAQKFVEAVWQNYTTLLHTTELPTHPALRSHVKEHILPGYALYRVLLQEHGGNKQASLGDVDEIFRAWTVERIWWMRLLFQMLPMPFWLFKIAADLKMRSYPAEGWDIAYPERSDTRLAFTITRCFYLNTLTGLGAPELTASFCKTDDVMAEAFPETIRFVRPHTMGRGDALCDFQYCYQARSPAKTAGQESSMEGML